MAVPNLVDINNMLEQYKIRANKGMTKIIEFNNKKLDNIKNSFILKNPLSIYEVKEQKLDSLIDKVNQLINSKLDTMKVKYQYLISSNILKDPIGVYLKKNDKIELLKNNANNVINNLIKEKVHQYGIIVNSLELLNPLNILSKGYSVVYQNDNIVNDINKVKINDILNIRMTNGIVKTKVEEVEENGK